MQKCAHIVGFENAANEYLLANIGFDTAENEPSKTWRTFRCENAFFVAKMHFMEKMHICHCRFEYPRHVRGFGRGRSGAARTSHRCSIGVGQGDQALHRKRQKRSLQAARYVNPMITSFAFPCPENSGSNYSFWKIGEIGTSSTIPLIFRGIAV